MIARAGLVLSIIATAINVQVAPAYVIYADLILIIGCCYSMLMSDRGEARHFIWWPIYFGYWIAISAMIFASGGISSPFAGVFLSLLFVGGVAIQKRFSWQVVLAFALMNFFGWGVLNSLGVTPPSEAFSSIVIAAMNAIGISALAAAIFGFLRTERELAHESQKHFKDLYEARDNLLREESANASKTAFLANVSHELRTPLGAILGFADLITDDVTTAEEKLDYAKTIRRNGEQLARLVDDLLDLSKVEAGKVEVENLEFHLPRLLSEILDLLSVGASSKGLSLEMNFETSIPEFVRTDPVRLRQILMNVIGNAIKFTDRGAIRISAQFEGFPGAETIRIRVRDGGRGMTQEEQKKLFQPFSQADPSMKRKYGGTGLGLSLSRQLSRLLGGELELVSSELGRGSEFLISIPVSRPETSHFVRSLKVTEEISSESVVLKPLAGMRILAVDDTEDNRRLLSRYLSGMGAVADFAFDGVECIQKAFANPGYDIILMDIQMPGLDGYQTTEILRQRGFKNPILALTAHAMPIDRENCIRAGCSGFLAKPFKKSDLASKISEHVVRRPKMVDNIRSIDLSL